MRIMSDKYAGWPVWIRRWWRFEAFLRLLQVTSIRTGCRITTRLIDFRHHFRAKCDDSSSNRSSVIIWADFVSYEQVKERLNEVRSVSVALSKTSISDVNSFISVSLINVHPAKPKANSGRPQKLWLPHGIMLQFVIVSFDCKRMSQPKIIFHFQNSVYMHLKYVSS